MLARIKALAQVGRYLGIEAMLAQVKENEKQELHRYLRRYFLNTYGLPQEEQMQACKYQQEAAEIGWEYINALYTI